VTLVWEYNAQSDQFYQIFNQAARHQTNGEIRIITSGPLAGDAGNSKYNDGSGLPVIDAEMAEVERRLQLWKPRDPLPTPVRTHCGTLELRHGVEWCR